MVVMHTCDIRNCVNPGHLKLGTTLDNVRDRDMKGRLSRGEAHYKAKLTQSAIDTIRTRRFSGVPRQVLSGEYGVSPTTITRVTQRESWKHITSQHPPRPTYGSGNPGAKLTEALIPIIRTRSRDGVLPSAIAREFGVAVETIRRILIGKRWTHVA
jgi:DNA invertase Pin-like site-specific DNA recombinase